MNKEIIPIFVLTAAIVTAITVMSTITPAALADKSSGSNGLEKADQNVHENTGGLSKQDFNFHVGTCQGGHSTAALDQIAGGCTLGSPSEFHSPKH
ncbi:MAG TPA: hypothetical protein VJ729_05430 [Nitrososphaeraceae archaeon]|nr:hypothetical protein [Nitrososphaeraceae archaeon]